MGVIDLAVGSAIGGGAAATATAAGRPWAMPRPRWGIVVWRNADGSGQPSFALVTNIYTGMVDLQVWPSPSERLVRTGVKHASDPTLRTMPNSSPNGVWDFCDGEKELRESLREATEIIRQQAELLAEVRRDNHRMQELVRGGDLPDE